MRKDNRKRIDISDDDIAWDSDLDALFEDPGRGTDGIRIPGASSEECAVEGRVLGDGSEWQQGNRGVW